MPTVRIESSDFVDGGIRDVVPLRRAIDKGYDNVVCIVCQTRTLRPVPAADNVISLIYRLYEIVQNEIIDNDLSIIAEKKAMANAIKHHSELAALLPSLVKTAAYENVELKIIQPEDAIRVDDENFNSSDIDEMINLGIETARDKKFRTLT